MKLKLTESQYNILLSKLDETRFDLSVNNNVKKEDVISITYKDNTTNNFKVIENNNGNILMDNIDAKSANINYRYYFRFDGLDYDKLELKRIHKEKQNDLLDGNPSSWNNYSIKNIKVIRVFNKQGIKKDDIDIAKKPLKKELKYDKKTPNFKELNDSILKKIGNELREKQTLIFNLSDGSEIILCVVSEHNYTYELNINEIKGNRHRYDFLRENNIILQFNESEGQNELDEIIKTKNNGQIKSIKLNLINKSNQLEKIYYLDFIDFSIGGACKDINNEKLNKEKKKSDKEKEETKDIMNLVLSDPLLKKAFISTPKLFNLIKIGDPVGVIPAEKLINGYMEKRTKEKLGVDAENFKSDKRVLYEFLNEPINQKLGKEILEIKLNERYLSRVKSFNYKDKNVILINTKPRYKIYITESVGTNIFKANLEKEYINENGFKENFKKIVTIKIKDYDY